MTLPLSRTSMVSFICSCWEGPPCTNRVSAHMLSIMAFNRLSSLCTITCSLEMTSLKQLATDAIKIVASRYVLDLCAASSNFVLSSLFSCGESRTVFCPKGQLARKASPAFFNPARAASGTSSGPITTSTIFSPLPSAKVSSAKTSSSSPQVSTLFATTG